MESALQHVRPAVGRQRTRELVGVGLAAHLLAVEAEGADLVAHVAGIIQRVADHIGHLRQRTVDAGLVEALGEHVAVDIRTDGHGGEDAALAGDGGVDAAERVDRLGGGGAHFLQVGQVRPVHHLFDGFLRIGEGGVLLGREGRAAREHRLRGLARIHETAAAHDDGLVEEALGQRRGAQELHAAGTGALAENHHVVRIAAELGDVFLDPFQDLDLVQGAPVAGGVLRILGRDLRMGEEAERAHAVVESHQDDILRAPVLAVELRLGAPAFAEAATEDPHGHGELLVHLAGRLGPDVQVEAILAVGGFVAITPLRGVAAGIVGRLERRMIEFVADLHALPGDDGLRRAPAVLAQRRSGVRDAAEDGDAGGVVEQDTLHLTALDGEDGVFRHGRARGEGQRAEENKYLSHIDRFNFRFSQVRKRIPPAQEPVRPLTKK